MNKLILYNGAICTSFTPLTFASALAILEETIIEVGSIEEVKAALPQAEAVDLDGKLVLPGFFDGHIHFELGGFFAELPSLLDIERKQAWEIIKREPFRHRHENRPGWIILGGLSLFTCPIQQADLDHIESYIPLVILSRDLHSAILNRPAMDLLEEKLSSQSRLSDRLFKSDHEGVVIESAVAEVLQLARQSNKEEIRKSLLTAQKLAHSFGITGISDNVNPLIAEVYRDLEESGELQLRVDAWMDSDEFNLQTLDFQPYQGKFFRLKTVKGYLDGSFGSRTAWLNEPYKGEANYRGIQRVDDAHLIDFLVQADRRGIRVALHALGDAAFDQALRAFESISFNPTLNHRIEHLQIAPAQYLDRMKRLGLTASVQPAHLLKDISISRNILGELRCRQIYPFKSMIERNIPLAFGTDWPVERLNPFQGIYIACQRNRLLENDEIGLFADEQIDLPRAISAYTIGSSIAGGWMNPHVMCIQQGIKADLAVYKKNFLKYPQNILNIKPEFIILNGIVDSQSCCM